MRKKHVISTFHFSYEKVGEEKVEIDATGFPAIIQSMKTKTQVLDTCCSQTAQKQAELDHMESFFKLIKILIKVLSLFDPSQDNYFRDMLWISNLAFCMG